MFADGALAVRALENFGSVGHWFGGGEGFGEGRGDFVEGWGQAGRGIF